MSGIEIERKFLVRDSTYRQQAHASSHIRQGYICSQQGKTVRVRMRDDKAYLTIKGPSADGGLSRYEFEKVISNSEAEQLLRICEPGLVEKTRFLVDYCGHTFEVDEFHGDNNGLIVAEVELSAPDEAVSLPPFIGQEVTGDRRYYNSQLRLRPFCLWEQ